MTALNGSEGQFCYLGIQPQLEKYISPDLYPSHEIRALCNIGIQIYNDNQRNECMWPINVKIFTEKCKAKITLVAIFYGKSKPQSP